MTVLLHAAESTNREMQKGGANLHDLDSLQWFHYSKCPKNMLNKINGIPQLLVLTSQVSQTTSHHVARTSYNV